MASPTVCGTGARSRRLIERVRAMYLLGRFQDGSEDAGRPKKPPPARRAPIPRLTLPVVATQKARIGPGWRDRGPCPPRRAFARAVTIRVTKKRRAAERAAGRKPDRRSIASVPAVPVPSAKLLMHLPIAAL